MPRRGLLACTLAVLLLHGALVSALRGHGLSQAGAPRGASADAPGQLVLLDRARVASLTPPPVIALPRAPAPSAAPEPAPASHPPVTARNEDDQTGAGGTITGAGGTLPGERSTTAVSYRSPAQLDQAPRPRSAPDISVLNDLPWSGMPIRIRLLIDSQGTVVEMQVLQSGEDPLVVDRLRQMFLATGFVPGQQQGRPVSSYKDIELTVGKPPA